MAPFRRQPTPPESLIQQVRGPRFAARDGNCEGILDVASKM